MVRVTPQGVDEDANRAASGADVFDLAAREPVVDRAPAHTDQFACLHDRDRFSFHLALASREVLYRSELDWGLGTESRQTHSYVSKYWRPRK
jgi:hypothetical protein